MSWESEPRVHGGMDPEEIRALGLAPREVVDFSVNVNAYGPCVPVVDALRQARLDVYPDPRARAAREAWARALDTSPDCICVGNGAADLFWAIVRAFVSSGDRVVIAEPTFSELRVAARVAGARVECVEAPEDAGFCIPLDELAKRAQGARLVYLCSPNNPTGEALPHARITALARALDPTMLVLDQSFLSFSDHASEALRRLPDNVVCVRSLTKDFALPGLRLGLAWAHPGHVGAVEAARPTWSTSAPALAAIEAAASQTEFVSQCWRRTRADRERVTALLRATGFSPLPSSTSFQLVRVGNGAAFRKALLQRGILVRDAASFGLPEYVRVAARPEAEALVLAAAIRDLRATRGLPL